jgi:cytochrome c-type biogenesis protein CcmE
MVSATKVLLSVAVIGGGAGMLIYSSLAEADYYKHVDEVVLAPDRWVDKSLKVHGFVQPGSIDERIVGQSTVRDFVLQYEGERIRVQHKGPKPDTFRDMAEVVATGTLVAQADGLQFQAHELSAKCPSKYEEERQKRGVPGLAKPTSSRQPAASTGMMGQPAASAPNAATSVAPSSR